MQDTLLARSPDSPNFKGQFAIPRGHVADVQVLLQDPPVDPSAHENEAIIYALRGGYLYANKMVNHEKEKGQEYVPN